ncbi:hypothetical protein L228DRAFT_267954 [Xylona heveae TC161]|uniref:Uncharacterized protein n=1 Tax=Xylona heveae (strain CBS 132557 / TC161) TaxID=1328760 RepID=A0A165GT23_XYLHT|nr:hypothetical protein L228DRAFT_267954 [Xylona heveae TC161]KZF22561.1 hypothetical protein L228DRAFT_267954 [Xylona heveae TC161]
MSSSSRSAVAPKTLGKRKRQTNESKAKVNGIKKSAGPKIQTTREPSAEEEESDAYEVFRRHFESQFKPIEEDLRPKQPKVEEKQADNDDEEDEEDEDSDWSGISDDEGKRKVEVVEHTGKPSNSNEYDDLAAKEEMKAFMSSKPPTAARKPIPKPQKSKENSEDENDEAANLKNDLALQRLLRESHLLDSNSSLDPTGKNRHKALDLRIQALGSNSSIMTQEKMPLSHRKGIMAKASEREEKRRREARENGIILEKPKLTKRKDAESRRERGVGGPGVGKFRGGMLKLSKRDIADIEGPKRMAKGKKGRR